MVYFNVLGGTLLAMGLRHASTGDFIVRDTLLHYLGHFMHLSELPATNFDQSLTRQTLINVQGTTCLALACVMVGTGDLEVFRYLRRLYSRTKKDTTFGDFLASQMAMGFLFMSSGQCVFDTSNFAIASLVLAFYPLFPQTLVSNTAHPQVYRYFWAFAATSRCLIVRDAMSHVPTGIDISIRLRSGTTVRRRAPCLLPTLDDIVTIETDGSKYHPVLLSLADPDNN
jgi:anaphase-promoting complex subunit 1